MSNKGSNSTNKPVSSSLSGNRGTTSQGSKDKVVSSAGDKNTKTSDSKSNLIEFNSFRNRRRENRY